MIKSLRIKNYALIKWLEMNPSTGLNIITGETGAGKSIMLGAVGLLIGNRCDTKILLDDNEKCVVEGIFDLSAYKLESLFREEDMDYDDECIIRREVSPNGKSRAFVNDVPTNLGTLKKLGARLMDVHSQHESLDLSAGSYQIKVLDAFAGHSDLVKQYKLKFRDYNHHKNEYELLIELSKKKTEDTEYRQFLLKELQDAKLDDINQDLSEQELETLENAEEIKLKLTHSSQLLNESEYAILHQLREMQQTLKIAGNFSEKIQALTERLHSTTIELQDIAREIEVNRDNIEHNPEKINQLRERLDLIYQLQKKHQVNDVTSLIEIRDKIDDDLSQITHLDDAIKKAHSTMKVAEREIRVAGNKLTESRKLFALNLSDEIEKLIKNIGIENGAIEIKIQSVDPSSEGMDMVDMYFSANKGIKPQKLREVASGGEFSRLIFIIKYLIADKISLPTIIFDEIDTGISGQVALQMIQMMKTMAKNHQVISISHLPQFAAGGEAHYFVYKDHSTHRSVSKIKRLEKEERVLEIAKMIGGETPAPSAVESARELLQIR